jgi:hypothetical protein
VTNAGKRKSLDEWIKLEQDWTNVLHFICCRDKSDNETNQNTDTTLDSHTFNIFYFSLNVCHIERTVTSLRKIAGIVSKTAVMYIRTGSNVNIFSEQGPVAGSYKHGSEFEVPYYAGKLLTRSATISFSRSTQLHRFRF